MHPAMTAMLAAQDIERELKVLKSQMEAVSIPLEKVKARRQATRRDVLVLRDKLEKTKLDLRQAEKELAELEQKLAAARTRQMAVRNPKEAQALEQEIERAEAAATKAEQETLELMDREQLLTERLEKETERVKRDLEQVIDPEIARLTGMLQEQQELAKALREEHITAMNKMDEDTRDTYEWLTNKHGTATAVSTVSGAACGGCGAMLLPDQIMKVKETEKLHRCDHCHRYLLPPE